MKDKKLEYLLEWQKSAEKPSNKPCRANIDMAEYAEFSKWDEQQKKIKLRKQKINKLLNDK